METMRLRSIQQPSHTQELLNSLVRGLKLHESARPIVDRSQLASALQRIAIEAANKGRSWGAWTDGYRVWFFTAEMSLPLSRERDRPVLQLESYSETGALRESSSWVSARDGSWSRCAA